MKRPESSQKDGMKTLRPTIGCKTVLIDSIIVSIINCPFDGIKEVLPTRSLTKIIMNNETTQLVTIELVIGNVPNLVISSDVRLTPPPAANPVDEKRIKSKTVKGDFKLKTHNYKFCLK